MLLTLCLAAVGGRLLARRIVKASLEADDYLAVGALVGKTSFDALIGTTLNHHRRQVVLVALGIEQFLSE